MRAARPCCCGPSGVCCLPLRIRRAAGCWPFEPFDPPDADAAAPLDPLSDPPPPAPLSDRRRRRRSRRLARFLGLFLRDFDQRQHVRFDHPQVRTCAQLAPQQAHRFEIRVDIVQAAGDEAHDVHALERRDIELRLDRRLDRNLVEVGAAGRGQHHHASDRCGS